MRLVLQRAETHNAFVLARLLELTKELLKLMVVERIRDWCRESCRRRGRKTNEVLYTIGGRLHKKKGCSHIKNTKKEIKKLMVCVDCVGALTDEEEA